MDCFRILGMEQTRDEKAMKLAYLQKLKVTNPEDDPEGFSDRLVTRTGFEPMLQP